MTLGFFDSNILLYAVNRDDPRGGRAAAILSGGGAISVQCLNEFAAVARRKLRWDWPEIGAALDRIIALCHPIVPIDIDLHRHGLRIAKDYRLSIYDGMIVSAALRAQCDTLYSEDMHAGLVVAGTLTVVNPFA